MGPTDVNQDNVLSVSFKDDDEAYAVLARLRQLDSENLIDLRAAAIVTRDPSGRVITKESAGREDSTGAITGGIVGLLIGVLGGPLGILIGGAGGVLVGSLFDEEDAEDTDSVLAAFSRTVRADHNTLLAELTEPSDHDVVDSVMTTRSGTLLRRAVTDVEAEIAAAEEAQRKAKKEARAHLREERKEKRKGDVDAKIAELKAKLPRHHAGKDSTESSMHAAQPN
jgi:uncharacterized membrane protein